MKKPIKILIIDDDEDGRFAFRRFLMPLTGFELDIVEAETGEEGLNLYQPHVFDIVLLDYSLPGISGINVLKKLKKAEPDAPVIMLTGQGDENVAVEVMKLGAIDYLPKDKVGTESMQRVIAHAIEQTELKREVRAQRRELESFANILAHDLKTPLGGVMSFAELLLIKTEKTEKYSDIQEEVQIIFQSAQHMNGLINSLQQYVNGSMELESCEFDLGQALEQVKNNLATAIAERRAVIRVDTDLPHIVGCKSQIIQLLQNLVANGIKYSNFTIPEVAVEVQYRDDGIVIAVKDNGIGIPEEKTEEIFDAFVRLHKDEEMFEGTGLGLATCKRIVERHKGRIWCTSQTGQGSIFWVYLPSSVIVADTMKRPQASHCA